MLGLLEIALTVTNGPNVHPGARCLRVEFQRFLVGFDHLAVGLAGLFQIKSPAKLNPRLKCAKA